MIKITIPLILLVTFVIAGNWYLAANADDTKPTNQNTTPLIQSFADCVAAGNPVLESFPEQCRTADGQLFTNTVTGVAVGEPVGGITEPTKLPNDTEREATMDAVRAAAAKDFAVDVEQIDIIDVTAHEWPDGCLGLATADEMCIMMITYGYEITVAAGTDTAVYRTDQTGAVVRKDV